MGGRQMLAYLGVMLSPERPSLSKAAFHAMTIVVMFGAAIFGSDLIKPSAYDRLEDAMLQIEETLEIEVTEENVLALRVVQYILLKEAQDIYNSNALRPAQHERIRAKWGVWLSIGNPDPRKIDGVPNISDKEAWRIYNEIQQKSRDAASDSKARVIIHPRLLSIYAFLFL